MKSKEFSIEFNKLRMGENSFAFELNDAFFQSIEGSPIAHAGVKADLVLVRSETMHELHFRLSGTVRTSCDNCLDEFDLPLKNEFTLLMKLSETEDYTDDEIVYITKGLLEYDLSQYLYESVVLSMPQRRVCAMAGKACNEETASKIIGPAEADGQETGEANPLWDKLKGIFNNN